MTCAIYLVLCTWACLVYGQGTRSDLYEEALTEATHLFSGLDGIKAYFRNNSNPLAKEILETFEKECFYMEEPELPAENKRKPFIVIEGNHQNSREVVGVRLARMLDGRYLIHPATCLVKHLDFIPKGTLLRRAYYVLSLYALSFNIRVHLSLGQAVVLNGYWLDQLTFALIHTFTSIDLPSVSSDVFSIPEGLLQPDLLVYLNLPDDLFCRQFTTRNPQNWKRRVMALYQGLQGRYPVVIQDLKGVFRLTADAVYQHVIERLNATRDVILRKHHTDFDYANE